MSNVVILHNAASHFMTRLTHIVVCMMAGLAGLSAAAAAEDTAPVKKLMVAVVTGGHRFDAQGFLKLFQDYDDIAYEHLPQKAGGEVFENVAAWPYDVIVLYNYNQTITPRQQDNFLKLLQRGLGLVVLHHANGAYNNWPEFWKIAGVEYHFAPWEQDGVTMAASGNKKPVRFTIHVADPHHLITRGLADYDIVDETYCRTSVDPGVHILLTTDEPSSDRIVGWTKTYRNSRVCYLQSGHDQTAYQNRNYRTLVVRAIRWTALAAVEEPGTPPGEASRR